MNQSEHDQWLQKVNSATKYPSIETYHQIGDRGRLDSALTLGPYGDYERVIGTEKVDGSNSRVILLPCELPHICGPADGELEPEFHMLYGSREELLHADGDMVFNPMNGIVPALRDIARSIRTQFDSTFVPYLTDSLNEMDAVVFYFETYGVRGNGEYKNYSKVGAAGYRLFDIAVIHFSDQKVLHASIEDIALWRDSGPRAVNRVQSFCGHEVLNEIASFLNIPTVPIVWEGRGRDIPRTLEGAQEWMREMGTTTRVGLDHSGRAEGIVLKSDSHRDLRTKLRFADYERTLQPNIKKVRLA